MRTMRYLVLLVCSLAGLGCSFGLDGDETRGEEGRSVWQIRDGLCPGFGGCALEVPLAAGASTEIEVTVPERDLGRLTVTADGPVAIGAPRDLDEERERFEVDVDATGDGDATLRLLDDGEEIDRVTMRVREPTAMRCGVVPADTAVGYELENLDEEARALTLPPPPADGSTPTRELACRLEADDGEALLSVRLVRWSVVDGTEVVRVDSEPFELDGASAAGARVDVQPLAVGTASVVARYGDFEERFDITVE